jgi:hypothetical protein
MDLLIERGVSMKKNRIEVLYVDAYEFAGLEPEA